MLLYVINVEACIHAENYRIFFYEPVAKKQLELFEASWEPASLTKAFREVASHINRRGFEGGDYQVIVCVRRRESDRWKETTLYAKAMVCRALEKSGTIPVITGSYTRKVMVLFQVEQPYYGTVPKTAVWEEELNGIQRFLDLLEIRTSMSETDEENGTLLQAAGLWGKRPASQWEEELAAAVERETAPGFGKDGETGAVKKPEKKTDRIFADLKERLRLAMDAERESGKEKEEEAPDADEALDALLAKQEEEQEEEGFDYISHRIRSLFDGSGLNRCTDVIYWPVAREISRANRISMLSLVDLLRNGEEVTREAVQSYYSSQDTEAEERLLDKYRAALAGYREQLSQKHDRILQEVISQEEQPVQKLSLSLPELSFRLAERIESAKQQLESCRISLKRSKRLEVRDRVEEISQSLTASFTGLEEELTAYEKEVTDCLYREIEGHSYAGFAEAAYGNAKKDSGFWNRPDQIGSRLQEGIPSFGTGKKNRETADEKTGKAGIRQWRREMQVLIDCTRLTGAAAAVFYLTGAAALAFVPWLVYQGTVLENKELLPVSVSLFGILLLALVIWRVFMPGYFIRSITAAYSQLEETLNQVLDQYQERANEYRDCAADWLEQEYELQNERRRNQKKQEMSELVSMRAWHLANMQKTLAGLETFQSFGEEWPKAAENPEVTRRILQPMDYKKKELGNEVYWPVIEKEEGRRIHE